MKLILTLICIAASFSGYTQNKEEVIKQIYDEVLMNSPVYEDLRVLCKDIGNRLSGSPGAAAAVEYTRQLMIKYDFDTVFLQPVMVPNWKRGKKEILKIVNSEKMGSIELNALALGNSVGTGAGGILGEIIEVSSLEAMAKVGDRAKGKIVFFNGPMDPTLMETFSAYGRAVGQRGGGASEAAKYGARAVVVRSVTQSLDDTPHTGSLRYQEEVRQIPAMAISTKDADILSRLLSDQSNLKIYMENYAVMKKPIMSYNVVGQINGIEYPNEFIAVGGHLDSWDVGEGAHDDGAGCMQGIEAVRVFKALGIKPKRTIRAVMWMNEENGLAGGREYARIANERNEKHIAALESDRGGFVPRGFNSNGTEAQVKKLKSWAPLFEPYGLHDFGKKGGGADIGPLLSQGTFLIGLLPDGQRYFKYHHTADDVFETVNRRELELGAASLASLIYLLDQDGM